MFCIHCGKENKDNAKFCMRCGKEIPCADMPEEISAENKIAKKVKRKVLTDKGKELMVLIAGVTVLILFSSVISYSSQKKYEEQLKIAERYLEEMDYDKAIAAYKTAIEIDPKGEKAYFGLEDTYVGKGDVQAAIDILTEGLEKSKSEAMEAHLEKLKKQLEEEKVAEIRELATRGKTNWCGGDWTNRGDILPFMNDDGYVVFGAYEQDGDELNGPEPVEWEVLEQNENGTLLVSRYVLDALPYNMDPVDVAWESCTLQNWLNKAFMNKAFTSAEQTVIKYTDLENLDNPKYGTSGGNNTTDRIFLLSVEEVISHYSFSAWYKEENNDEFGYSMDLMIEPTEYAKQRGVEWEEIDEDLYYGRDLFYHGLEKENYSTDCIGRVCAPWWLRSPGHEATYACDVSCAGSVGIRYGITVVYGRYGIRPALYISQYGSSSSENTQSITSGKSASKYFASGCDYERQEKYDKAIEQFKVAIDADNQYLDAYIEIINCYKRIKDYDKAFEYCKKAGENLSDEQVEAFNHKYYAYNLERIDHIRTAIMYAACDYLDDSEMSKWNGKTIDASTIVKENGNISSAFFDYYGNEKVNGKEVVADITLIGDVSVKIQFRKEPRLGCKVYVVGYEDSLCVE